MATFPSKRTSEEKSKYELESSVAWIKLILSEAFHNNEVRHYPVRIFFLLLPSRVEDDVNIPVKLTMLCNIASNSVYNMNIRLIESVIAIISIYEPQFLSWTSFLRIHRNLSHLQQILQAANGVPLYV
jgi:hypothetical protein